jgi:RNase P subunit RPR2
MDAVTEAEATETAQPQPGDETVCFHCTTVLVYGPLGKVRVEDPREISAQALKIQADLQAFQRRFPRRGDAP